MDREKFTVHVMFNQGSATARLDSWDEFERFCAMFLRFPHTETLIDTPAAKVEPKQQPASPQPQPRPQPQPEPKPEQAPKQGITHDSLMPDVLEAIKRDRAAVQELIKSFGVNRFSEIPAEKLSEFAAHLDSLHVQEDDVPF